ncbi:hypothetical protein [Methylocella sp.]|uniref:hypothetical protein n=1 Tax=Methylocella sp. TaxID=1978226 RepID=UPI0035B1D276
MTRRGAFLVFLLALSLPALAQQRVQPPPALTEAVVEGPKNPYVGEMLVLRLRSVIGAPVARHEIQQPELINFDWRQFGRDVEVAADLDGVPARGMERRIAIFPREAGALTIGPFTRKVELIEPDNSRHDASFSSAPVVVEARPHEGVGKPDDFWLPARSVTLTDSWDPAPDRLGLNDTTRRTLTIEAQGLTADRLPPAPNMRAPGVIVFAAPVERQTIATQDGLSARAVYRYDIRPVSADAAAMPPVRVPWFDTAERRMREASVAGRTVAFLDPNRRARRDERPGADGAGRRLLAAALVGALWALALAAAILSAEGIGERVAEWTSPARGLLARARRAARRGDARGVKAQALALARLDPARFSRACRDPRLAQELAALDAALYGRAGDGDAREFDARRLRALAGLLARAWGAARTDKARAAGALA